MREIIDDWPHPRNFRVVAVATSVETPGSTYGPFQIDRYSFTWIVEGGGQTFLDAEQINTSPGTVMLMRPGMTLRHNWGPSRSFQTFITFDFDRVKPPWPPISDWPLTRQLDADDVLFNMWGFVLSCSRAAPRRDAVMVSAIELMVRMLITGATGAAPVTAISLPKPVESALAHMQAHLNTVPAEPIRLSEIAHRVHVSEQHLCRLFKQNLGESPMQCVQLLRLELAGSLLDRTEMSVAEIAEKLGYSSQFHFSRSFKAGYGMSPSAYRKAFLDGSTVRPAGLLYRHHRLRQYIYEEAPGKVIRPR